MPRVTSHIARKDYPESGIKKGGKYYTWGFAFGPTCKSLTYPTRQQLTCSEFMQAVFDIDDSLSSINCIDDLESEINTAVDELQSLADEQEEKRSNMPEGLQDAEVGQLLEERADQLREWADGLDSIDCYFDEEGETEEAEAVARESLDEEEDAEAFETKVQELLEEKKDEFLEEKKEEISSLMPF